MSKRKPKVAARETKRKVVKGRGRRPSVSLKRTRAQKTARRRATSVVARSARRIDAAFKTITLAAEPPINADPTKLDAAFRTRLDAVLAQLRTERIPFKFVEGFRTVERQQWLFGSGRPTVVPFGRPGPILTHADGVTKISKHQGTSVPGSGRAADCYPLRNGKVFIPPSSDPVWKAYATVVVAHGLVAGHNFSTLKDSPHCELSLMPLRLP